MKDGDWRQSFCGYSLMLRVTNVPFYHEFGTVIKERDIIRARNMKRI